MGDKSKIGRPSKYKEEYAEQARKLCLLGATDAELSDFFGVCEKTLNNWKVEHEVFLQSIQRGKILADAEVAEKLYHRALGYSHRAEKIMVVDKRVVRAEYTEHYPPDTPAASLWLRNRQSAKWRDKQEIEHGGEIKTPELKLVLHGTRTPPATD